MSALRAGLGTAVTVAVVVVVAVVLVVVGSRAPHGVNPRGAARPDAGTAPPAPESLVPAHGGMRGLLSTPQPFGSGPDLNARFDQCLRCHLHLRSGGTLWQSRSVDGGRTWHTRRLPASRIELGAAVQAGRTIWTTGDLGEIPTIFVSHDDGEHFAAAATADPPAGESPLTIDDGTVWALGNRCERRICRAVVLSGPVGGDRLAATASAPAPALRPHVNGVQAVIGVHGSTVLVTGGFAATDLQTFVAHDRGRSWSQVSYPCQRPSRATST